MTVAKYDSQVDCIAGNLNNYTLSRQGNLQNSGNTGTIPTHFSGNPASADGNDITCPEDGGKYLRAYPHGSTHWNYGCTCVYSYDRNFYY